MYTFKEDCRLGIEEIDKEHEELFRLINEAQELLDQKMASEKIVANIVDHLGRYAREHFAHEEAYMDSIKDPELPRQKKEHQEFAAKIESIELSGAGEEESRDILANLVQYLGIGSGAEEEMRNYILEFMQYVLSEDKQQSLMELGLIPAVAAKAQLESETPAVSAIYENSSQPAVPQCFLYATYEDQLCQSAEKALSGD